MRHVTVALPDKVAATLNERAAKARTPARLLAAKLLTEALAPKVAASKSARSEKVQR